MNPNAHSWPHEGLTIFRRPRFTIFSLGLLLLLHLSRANAGPPLTLDDPGILVPGGFEIVLASQAEQHESGHFSESPVLDISLGLTDQTQLSLNLPWQSTKLPDETVRSGFGSASIVYKWRFLQSSRWNLAIAPGYSQPISYDFIARDSEEDNNSVSIPLLASFTVNELTLLGSWAWNVDSRGDAHWDYGLAMIHPLTDRVTAMLEISGHFESYLRHPNNGIQVGVAWRMSPSLNLLGSMGKSFGGGDEPEMELNYRYFIGLQWTPQLKG